jgi:hypothetical protein
MRWRRLRVALGAVVWIGMPWGLQGMLQQSGWAQHTVDSQGLLHFHALWLVWLLGGVGGGPGTSGEWLDENTSRPSRCAGCS